MSDANEKPAPTRADGVKPFNGYLWPTESWWLGHERRGFDSRWHFGYVALNDRRFSVEGSVYAIRGNQDGEGRPCVFATREKAIRVSAARMIAVMRASRHWGANAETYGAMSGRKLAEGINWALAIVARETADGAFLAVTIPDPKPERGPTGLPLFDFANHEL